MEGAMSNIINKGELEKALKEAGRKSVSWQSWPKTNRSGQVMPNPGETMQPHSKYEVSRFQIPINELLALPKEQLSLLLLATKISNEVLLLQRHAIVCQKGVLAADRERDFEERHGQVAMFSMTLMQLIGKLWEAHQALRDHAKNWKPGGTLVISEEGIKSWRNLNIAFGNQSIMGTIRDKISFHFDVDVLCSQLTSNFGDGQFKMLLSTDYTNTLFLTTEDISGYAALEFVEPKDDKQVAMDNLFTLATNTALLMMNFSTEVVLAILDRVSSISNGTEIAMAHRPMLGQQTLPFLVQPPRRKNK
jgi:hypothetical protein